MTERGGRHFELQNRGRRSVQASFHAGSVTFDAGALLVRQVETKFHFIERWAGCCTDHRDPDRLEHALVDLLQQPTQCMAINWAASFTATIAVIVFCR